MGQQKRERKHIKTAFFSPFHSLDPLLFKSLGSCSSLRRPPRHFLPHLALNGVTPRKGVKFGA